MSLFDSQTHRDKLLDHNRVLFDAHHNTLKTQSDADSARKAEATLCRRFQDWCSQERDEIRRRLADTAQVFEPTEQAEWQKLHDDIVEWLAVLENECPPGEDPSPATGRQAQRTIHPIS